MVPDNMMIGKPHWLTYQQSKKNVFRGSPFTSVILLGYYHTRQLMLNCGVITMGVSDGMTLPGAIA